MLCAGVRSLPFNDLATPVEFETELFKGRALVLFRGMPNTPPGVFEGKRRLMWMTIQVCACASCMCSA